MRLALLLWLVSVSALVSLPEPSHAREPIEVFVVGAAPGARRASRRPFPARVGETVALDVVVKRGRGRKARWAR